MSKKRMSDEEAKRWRKIVFMDDEREDRHPGRRSQSYVYGERHPQSWWHRLKAHFSHH
ncbi:hypothetical protein [Levilactobacillus suantsaii]|uniref:hypothetical protein n=1 Tax=Levilactobacillus suantsaii TaxID=2292255 RepID=UPI001482C99D|nr:hypothetical protein [Levilactobacillus suantsaii]QMU07188.1 hypothetical protein H3M12_06695 [Levilactobacillus suantsaii]